jgi:glycosyltransferase involved in cell wall biosynthesis
MNILQINHHAGSNKHGMALRPFYLGREWVRMGHQVTTVAGSFSHGRTHAPVIRGPVTAEEIEGIQYLWLKTPPYRGNGGARVRNMLAFVTGLVRRGIGLQLGDRPDVVIASSTYPLDIWPAYRIARATRARLIFEVHDLWPLSLIELGGLSPRHPFIMLVQAAENFAYRKADRVVSMLPKAESHMRAHGLAPGKFTHIPNGVDVKEWERGQTDLPAEHVERLTALRSGGQFLVGYTGSHGLANALHSLLDAAQILRQDPVTFVLVGKGPEKEVLQRRAEAHGLTNVFFLPPVVRPSMPRLLARMDALFIGWNKRPLYRFGISPNKLTEYMMSGRPVIHAVEAGNDLVAESGCGLSTPAEDPDAIAGAVRRLMRSSPDEREQMGLRGRTYALQHHDYRVLAQRFIEAVTQ